MINNPCSWFANGGSYNNLKRFEYEGGSKLYHFSPDIKIDKLFDHWRPINLIFFANDEEHAKDVIKRMLEFRIKCRTEHEAYAGTDYTRSEEMRTLPELLLSKIDKWTITLAPTGQFYQVGWAINDNIL